MLVDYDGKVYCIVLTSEIVKGGDWGDDVMATGTRGCTWAIGQTGVIKCMLIHTFYDPCCPITHLTPE